MSSNSTIIICGVALIAISIVAKLFFWKKRNTKSFEKFVRSFFKLYGKNRLYDASSENKKKFLIASNVINIIWWTLLLILILVYFYLNK